jgi:hypothetical protein
MKTEKTEEKFKELLKEAVKSGFRGDKIEDGAIRKEFFTNQNNSQKPSNTIRNPNVQKPLQEKLPQK